VNIRNRRQLSVNVVAQSITASVAPQTDSGALSLAARHAQRAKWESLSLSALILLVAAAGILGLWVTTRNSAYAGFGHELISLAQEAAAQVDPQLHEQIRRPEQLNGPEYLRAVEPLRRIRKAVPDIHYVYTLVLADGEVHFVLDASDPTTRSTTGQLDQSGVWEVYRHRSSVLTAALGDGGHPGVPIASLEPTTDEWGTWVSGFAPLRDAKGRQIGVLGVDVDGSRFLASRAASRRRALLGLVPAGILTAILGGLFYRVRRRGLADAQAATEQAAEAQRTAAVLAEERRRLSAVIEGANVGTWEWHSNTRLISINERAAVLSGHPPEKPVRLTWRDLRLRVHQEDYPGLKRAVSECLSQVDTVSAHEFRVQRADGQWLWVLARGKVMQVDGRGRVCAIGGVMLDVSAHKALENALIKSAQEDRLTGLPNRSVFMERLEQALNRVRHRQDSGCAVLFFDFDRFKAVNDTLGHEAGDELLRQIGQRLQTALRSEDCGDIEAGLISRFGGDEFLILIDHLHGTTEAVRIAERLLNALTASYTVLGHDVQSTASVGIVTSDQCKGSAEEFVRNADMAMYEAKRAGRSCAVVFSEAMHARLTRNLTIETSLRRAIGTEQLHLEYQPVVDLDSGRRRSVEVCVRWNHPTMGPIAPEEFIPIAEKSGLLVAIGQWRLEAACREMARWLKRADPQTPDTISIHLSAAELALGERLIRKVRSTLHSSELPPAALQLDVSESELLRNGAAVVEVLQQLRQLGVKLAVDEFGAGHGSLSVLRQVPLDAVKIDRSFLLNLHGSHGNLAVLSATLTLIRNLGLQSIADGVEDSTQIAILQSLGCQCAQGPFFGFSIDAGEALAAVIAP
jgi:diguanylate cyclase (GGDEF)-like protein/PAS domain S-box-containing protein